MYRARSLSTIRSKPGQPLLLRRKQASNLSTCQIRLPAARLERQKHAPQTILARSTRTISTTGSDPGHAVSGATGDLSKGGDLGESSSHELTDLRKKLLSYDSLKAAVEDRHEDYSSNPRFSQLIVADLLKIVRADDVDMSKRDLMKVMHTLVLPEKDMTIPSHALKAILELVVTAVQKRKNMQQLEDAIVAEDLYSKIASIQIYYTEDYSPRLYTAWNKSALTVLNCVLNLYANVLQNGSVTRNAAAARDVVQVAEKLLTDTHDRTVSPERLAIFPDTVSFNTVMTAWGNSVGHRQNAAAKHAAERSESILGMLLDVADSVPTLKPSSHSYNAVIKAWSQVRAPHVEDHVLKLVNLMGQRHAENPRQHPAIIPQTLVLACSALRNCSGHDIIESMKKLRTLQDSYKVPINTITGNAILTAYSKSLPRNHALCKQMIDFYDSRKVDPDRITFAIIIFALSDAVIRAKHPNDYLARQAMAFLDKATAQKVETVRMYNDAMGAHIFHPRGAKEIFDRLGDDADFDSYRFMLKAYEKSARSSNDFAEKASVLLTEMEERAVFSKGLRPGTTHYNSVILAWLGSHDLKGVEKADECLRHLCETYQRRLAEAQNATGKAQAIRERPNTTSFVPVIHGYMKFGGRSHLEQMDAILTQMLDLEMANLQATPELKLAVADVQMNRVPYNMLLNAYAKHASGDLSLVTRAENLFKRMETSLVAQSKPDGYSFTALIKVYGAAKLPDTAARVTRIMDIANRVGERNGAHVMDTRLYNAAISAIRSVESPEVERIQALVDQMEDSGHAQPDAYTYGVLLNQWANVGTMAAMRRAEQVLSRAVASGKADTFCFNSVIAGYSKHKTKEAAERRSAVTSEMKRLGTDGHDNITPNAFTQQTITKNEAPQEAHESVHRMVQKFKESGNNADKPNPRTFSHVLSKWFRCQEDPEAATKALDMFRLKQDFARTHEGDIPSQYDIDTIIKILERSGMDSKALEVKNEFADVTSIDGYYEMIKKLSTDAANRFEVMELFDALKQRCADMEGSGKPDKVAYRFCLNVWLRSDDLSRDERADEILLEWDALDDSTLKFSYQAVLRACRICATESPSKTSRTASIQRGARLFARVVEIGGANETAFSDMLLLTSLLPNTDRAKTALFQKLISQCQKDGFLSPNILGVITTHVHPQLCAKMLSVHADEVPTLTLRQLPAEWFRNIRPEKPQKRDSK